MKGCSSVIILACTFLSTHSALALDVVLDISRIDEVLYKSFLLFYDDVPTRIVMPRKGIKIRSVKEGSENLWKAEGREKCILITLHLKNGRPMMMFMSIHGSSTRYIGLCKSDGIWKLGPDDFEHRNREFAKLRMIPSSTHTFTLNVSTSEENDERIVLESVALKRKTRMHIPELGSYATKVVCGQELIWKAKDGERCITAFSYFRNGRLQRISVLVNQKSGSDSEIRHYEKRGTLWRKVKHDNFGNGQLVPLVHIEMSNYNI
ncbi:signal peptide-containing protein [Theileria equi strain WA]|uniref:Signal peptide-containing protein n=1 Tax=Theileria equi strain WA TaxID=1537102 RepID=L0AWX7_THEEQ|nr:signal peptide-containing protein [Theileria equi strain WA]AFZ79526.1 signal peptide-containing protein [Theileria equi strain WA]|eukprot:XP_004829192.1 signal peptide-containing protein [Theileria equi strain WA]